MISDCHDQKVRQSQLQYDSALTCVFPVEAGAPGGADSCPWHAHGSLDSRWSCGELHPSPASRLACNRSERLSPARRAAALGPRSFNQQPPGSSLMGRSSRENLHGMALKSQCQSWVPKEAFKKQGVSTRAISTLNPDTTGVPQPQRNSYRQAGRTPPTGHFEENLDHPGQRQKTSFMAQAKTQRAPPPSPDGQIACGFSEEADVGNTQSPTWDLGGGWEDSKHLLSSADAGGWGQTRGM